MKTEQRNLKKHLFICCNKKENGESCGPKGSEALVKSLKTKLRGNDLWDQVKVSKSGCLGPCSSGISAVLYPDNKLLTEISESDFDEIYNMLIE